MTAHSAARRPYWLLLVPLLVAASSCAPAEGAPAAARRIFTVDGFEQPESVVYDSAQDLYFVSNMFGAGSVKDGRGYISVFDAGNPLDATTFVVSGTPGVILHAPKGMTLQGDTLWVADIDVVRGFHRITGEPVGGIDLAPHGALLLNSAAVGPDGTLYVTDTGIVMAPEGVHYPGGDKIFAIRGGMVSIFAEGEALLHPNGIRWDAEGERLVVAGFNPFGTEAYALDPGTSERTVLARGPGRFDGIEVGSGGRIFVGSWSDSSIYMVTGDVQERLIRGVWQPADLGYDSRRGRLAIPLVLQGRVEIWEVPG